MESNNIIGELIAGRYRIEKVLGKGGYGSIYEATDQQFRGAVAVKILDIKKIQPGSRDLSRFENEAKILSKIRHPNVVQVYDFGVHERWPYIIMERLTGHDLKHEISLGPISFERAFKLFSGALEGLGYAHQRGLIHKDIKPANLFIDTSGETERLVVVDYGIGVDAGGEMERFTVTGSIAGTPSYIPPEYITDAIVSSQNDVYQIALTLVESLTGQKVVDGESTFETLKAHMNGRLSIPDWFQHHKWFDVVMCALSVELETRYLTADAFLSALEAVELSTNQKTVENEKPKPRLTKETRVESVSKIPITPRPSLGKKSGRRKYVFGGCLSIFLSIAALLALSFVLAVFSERGVFLYFHQMCFFGGCEQTCSGPGVCTFECEGGECEQTCVPAAQVCSFLCKGGGCEQKCVAGAHCVFYCEGGKCSQSRNNAKSFQWQCKGDGCKIEK